MRRGVVWLLAKEIGMGHASHGLKRVVKSVCHQRRSYCVVNASPTGVRCGRRSGVDLSRIVHRRECHHPV